MRRMGRKELFKLQVTSLDGIPDLDLHTHTHTYSLRSHDVILISPHPATPPIPAYHHLSFFFLLLPPPPFYYYYSKHNCLKGVFIPPRGSLKKEQFKSMSSFLLISFFLCVVEFVRIVLSLIDDILSSTTRVV